MEDINHQNGDNPQDESPDNDNLINEKIENLQEDLRGIKSILEEAASYEPPAPEPVKPKGKHRFDEQPPQTYEELLEEAANVAREKLLAEQEQQQKAEQEQYQKIEKERQELHGKWDSQEAQLEKAGKLPKVINPDDPEDEGRKARVELYKTALELGSTNLVAVYDRAIAPAKGVGRTKPAGAKAPVGGNTASNAMDNRPRDYRNIKRPLDDVRKEYFPDSY